MKKLIIYILLLMSLAGCEKKSLWTLSEQASRIVVLNSIITDEYKTQTIQLNYSVSSLNETPKPVSPAHVYISNEDSLYKFTEHPLGSGIYRSDLQFGARSALHYHLLIVFRNKIFTASATMDPGIIPSPLSYSKDDGSALYHLDWVASSFSTQPPAMWEVLLDWSKVPGYQQEDSVKNHARMLFYTLSTLDVSEIFAPRMESISFPSGTIITERSYSLTNDYAEFIRQLLLETQWQGGLFSSARANVPTNILGGAAGFFAVCAVNTVSLTVGP